MNKLPRRSRLARRRSAVARRGMTLLELAMVVSILAILTALVVPGFTGQMEDTRKMAAKASLQNLRNLVADRFLDDMNGLPGPHALDTTRRSATAQLSAYPNEFPQMHFMFVNPNQYASASNPQYVAVRDYDPVARIGWNGPYAMNVATTYPDPTAVRFTNDPNNTLTWAQYGFTTTFGLKGDFAVFDPWGSPIVIVLKTHSHGGTNNVLTEYVVSAGPNRTLDQASWSFNTDGSLNSGDDVALAIRSRKP